MNGKFALFLLLLSPNFVLASGGTAVIPYIDAYFASTSNMKDYYITVSNITGDPISVSISLYKSDGSLVTDDNNPTQGHVRGYLVYSNYSEPSSGKTVSFTVGAHLTGGMNLRFSNPSDSTYGHGYGTIEWAQDSNITHGAVASIFIIYDVGGKNGVPVIPINGGLPF